MMISRTRIALLSVSLCGLAACGGGGDVTIQPDPPEAEDPPATSSDFSVLSANFDALEGAIPSTGSLPAQVDPSGTATYTGFFSGELDPDPDTTESDVAAGNVDFIAGDAQILIDFGNDNETIGAAGNFQSDTVDSIDGTVVLFDFETTRTASAVVFVGNYGGDLTITDDDYPTGAQTIAGRFGGGYFGTDGEFVTAVTVPVDGFNDIYFDGDIVAEVAP